MQLEPYRPQRPMRELQAELGLERIVKLSSNEGAFGPLPAAVAAFEAAAAELNRYPDGSGRRLREELAAHHGLPLEQLVLGNGADELIRLCAVATIDPAIAACTRGRRSRATAPRSCAAAASRSPCLPPVALPISTPCWPRWRTAETRTKLVCLANPNNPIGNVIDPGELRRVPRAAPGDVLCVLDEAYADYADVEPEGIALVREGVPRLAVLRTFSKVYGLASLRVGYALASAEVADALDRVRPMFNVSQPAQEAALGHRYTSARRWRERIEHARRARGELADALAGAGLDPEPSQTNFVYADVPDGDGAGSDRRAAARGRDGARARRASGRRRPCA